MVSDTLQRAVFHLAAIETNKDSVIIFEEPEAHAFPYYTKFLAERIALDKTNQYFISTHNPYFLLSVLEKTPKEGVGIFMLKNGKSKGLVDEDPLSAQPSYIGKLKIKLNEQDIKLLYDESAQNHLVVLCPRLEDWILKAAKEAGVKVEDYNLPKDVDEFYKIINIKPERIVPLTQDIKKKKGKMLKTLEGLLKK